MGDKRPAEGSEVRSDLGNHLKYQASLVIGSQENSDWHNSGRSLTQPCAQGRSSVEVRAGCSVWSWKLPRTETAQPLWETSFPAWLPEGWKGFSLNPTWITSISTYAWCFSFSHHAPGSIFFLPKTVLQKAPQPHKASISALVMTFHWNFFRLLISFIVLEYSKLHAVFWMQATE